MIMIIGRLKRYGVKDKEHYNAMRVVINSLIINLITKYKQMILKINQMNTIHCLLIPIMDQ